MLDENKYKIVKREDLRVDCTPIICIDEIGRTVEVLFWDHFINLPDHVNRTGPYCSDMCEFFLDCNLRKRSAKENIPSCLKQEDCDELIEEMNNLIALRLL